MNSARGTFPRAWLLPVFADHIKNTELAFFTETMLPLANRMAAKAEELQAVGQVSAVRSVISGPGYPTDPAAMRALVERNIDRRYYPAGAARQYLAIMASGPRVELLKTVKVPTLVLHGEDDPLLPVECGRDVATLVPGAKIETFAGWGHDVPEAMVPKLVSSISTFCKAA